MGLPVDGSEQVGLSSGAPRNFGLPHAAWSPTGYEKVWMKVVHRHPANAGMVFALMFQPGARCPLYVHPSSDLAFVLHGSITDREGTCRAGECLWRAAGSCHEYRSDTGAVLLGFSLGARFSLFPSKTHG